MIKFLLINLLILKFGGHGHGVALVEAGLGLLGAQELLVDDFLSVRNTVVVASEGPEGSQDLVVDVFH